MSDSQDEKSFKEKIALLLLLLNLDNIQWHEMLQTILLKSAQVSAALALALVDDIKLAAITAIEMRLSTAEFSKLLDEVIANKGWVTTKDQKRIIEAWRPRVIANANLTTANMKGMWSQVKQAAIPYMMYLHSPYVKVPRPVHVKWHGMLLATDHSWWRTHFPPNGFGCQCSIVALTEQDVKARGLRVTPDVNIYPGDADEGWGDYPGT